MVSQGEIDAFKEDDQYAGAETDEFGARRKIEWTRVSERRWA